MKKSLAIHIDYGSKGNSGLYMHEILANLEGDFDCEAYLHSQYEYQSKGKIHKVFDKYSSYLNVEKLKQVYKLIDLYYVLIRLLIRVLFIRDRKVYLFMSLYEPFSIYKFFLRFARLNKGVTNIATVHDAEPLFNNYPAIIMTSQNEIIYYSHFLIVHTDDSMQKLSALGKTMFKCPFPLMKLNEVKEPKVNSCIKFLFLGYLRKEKGVDLLIDAWSYIEKKFTNVQLTIAGGVPFGLQYEFDKLNKSKLLLHYIPDELYAKLIHDCDYGILPYTGGTNSGIVSTMASMDKPTITSDLPMFKESAFVLPQLLFKTGDLTSLQEKISETIQSHLNNYPGLMREIKTRNNSYSNQFKIELNHTYNQIFSSNSLFNTELLK